MNFIHLNGANTVQPRLMFDGFKHLENAECTGWHRWQARLIIYELTGWQNQSKSKCASCVCSLCVQVVSGLIFLCFRQHMLKHRECVMACLKERRIFFSILDNIYANIYRECVMTWLKGKSKSIQILDEKI